MKQLEHFPAIAWDFDGVLIDHPKSSLFHGFIRSQPDKRHYILTFRTHGLQHRMFSEMLSRYPAAPGPEQFAGTANISDYAWERFIQDERRRLLRQFDGPLTAWETYYVEWKGLTCVRLNLPVLIDDKPEYVLPGCETYGVAYVHPDDL